MSRSSVASKSEGVKQSVAKKATAKKTVASKTTSPRKKVSVVRADKKATKATKVTATKSIKTKSKTITKLAKSVTPTATIKRNPLGHLLIEKLLREAGFRGEISTKKELLEAYSTDESVFNIRPQVVLQPKNRRDVEIATKVVAEETKRFTSLSLTPRAAGTGLSGGSLTDSIVIDVSAHLDKIGEVVEKKGKIIFSCEPGAMWRDVEKRLKSHGAYLPPYPASKDICTVGGSVANNAAGPDSLRHGHCADWVESLDVVLADGHTYTIKPLSFREFKLLIKQDHEHARITREIFELISKNEKEIKKAQPKTPKNTAGYPLWSVLPEGVAKFKKGEGTFDLTRLISGSQGTVGLIVSLTMRAELLPKNTTLIALPIFELEDASDCVVKALEHNPINVEVFDALTFDLALKNPGFFRDRIDGSKYYQTMFSMYTLYHVRYKRRIPEFTVLITLDEETTKKKDVSEIVKKISNARSTARVIKGRIETEMLWNIRRASYSLSKLQNPTKRPAAFLEDMTVPPENLSKFFVQVKRLLKEFNVTAAVHGHGGNGHFHFYPLLDFTNKTTPALIKKMSEKFFEVAVKFKGGICGEHNDGIIRTPYLDKMFSKTTIELFEKTEAIFDPNDIFNPGKKVNPRFDIKNNVRTTN